MLIAYVRAWVRLSLSKTFANANTHRSCSLYAYGAWEGHDGGHAEGSRWAEFDEEGG